MPRRALLILLLIATPTILLGQGGNPLDLATWSPTTILAVASVVFSFGIAWNQHKGHGKQLAQHELKLEAQGEKLALLRAWRDELAHPTLLEHGERLHEVEDRLSRRARPV